MKILHHNAISIEVIFLLQFLKYMTIKNTISLLNYDITRTLVSNQNIVDMSDVEMILKHCIKQNC